MMAFQAQCLALTGQAIFKEGSGRKVDGTLVVAVQEVGVGSMAQQEGTHLHAVLGRGLVQRSELPQIRCVNTGTVLKNTREEISVLIGTAYKIQ